MGESYLGARRVKGVWGRRTRDKTIRGLLKRNGRVYTEIVLDSQLIAFQGIIRGRVEIERIIPLMAGVPTIAW